MDTTIPTPQTPIADFAATAETDLFSFIDQKDYHTVLNKQENMPYVIRLGGIFLCLEGEGDVIINEQKYHLQPRTMCLAFKGYTIAINIDFIHDINIPSATSLYMLIRDYPCVVLTQEQTDCILELCEMMRRKNARKQHPFRMQINSQILLTLCYELAAIYTQYHPVKRQPCSRQDTLFRRFLSLLATDITVSREVQYYADKLYFKICKGGAPAVGFRIQRRQQHRHSRADRDAEDDRIRSRKADRARDGQCLKDADRSARALQNAGEKRARQYAEKRI